MYSKSWSLDYLDLSIRYTISREFDLIRLAHVGIWRAVMTLNSIAILFPSGFTLHEAKRLVSLEHLHITWVWWREASEMVYHWIGGVLSNLLVGPARLVINSLREPFEGGIRAPFMASPHQILQPGPQQTGGLRSKYWIEMWASIDDVR